MAGLFCCCIRSPGSIPRKYQYREEEEITIPTVSKPVPFISQEKQVMQRTWSYTDISSRNVDRHSIRVTGDLTPSAKEYSTSNIGSCAPEVGTSASKMRRELLGFGLAGDGQLGIRCSSDIITIRAPEHIIGAPNGEHGSAVRGVACGEKHTLFLDETGKVWSVGGNEHGQLGRGSKNEGSFTIYPLPHFCGGVQVIQIAAGRVHSMAVVEDGRLFGWGSNEHGQLGMSSQHRVITSPKRISISVSDSSGGKVDVVQVACGPDHAVALLDCGRVFVWGEQWDGANIHNPVEIELFNTIPVSRVLAGGRHCMTISVTGSVYAWGQNEYGQLGVGDTLPRSKPEFLSNVSEMGVVEGACGFSHSILMTVDGKLFAFGSDAFGQLGNGKKLEKQSSPTVITELMGSHVTRIACGRCHTVAVIGGKVFPFGLNSSGQLGNGQFRSQITPSQTDEIDHVSALFAGWDQTFIIRAGGVPDVASGPNCELRVPSIIPPGKVQEMLGKRDKLDLLELLVSVFSSLSKINGSFLLSDHRRFLCDGHGVDLDAVMDAFNAIAATSDARQYADELMDALQRSVFLSGGLSRTFDSPECLRVFLVLPWLDAFVMNVTEVTVRVLHMPFASAIVSLKESMMNKLERWWSLLPMRHFNRIVSAMLAGVRCNLRQHADPCLSQPMLVVLSALNKINKATNTLPLDKFYLNELSEKRDLLREDYVKWKLHNEKNSWSNYPFLFNAVAKADLLHIEAMVSQQMSISEGSVSILGMNFLFEVPYFEIHVRREHVVHDTMSELVAAVHEVADKRHLLKPLKVRFVNEEGDDAGGVRKEFFIILFQQILHAEYGMFTENEESHLVWFSGLSVQEHEHFHMLGILCGMAVYNSVLVPFPFPLALYKYLLDQALSLEDLAELSPAEGRGLQHLLDYEGDDMEETFCLNFSIGYSEFGAIHSVDLKENGSEIPVTQHNKQEYVQLYVQHRLEEGNNGEIRNQMSAFKSGFSSLMRLHLLQFFQPRELMEMIVGNENYDWTEFREVVKYKEPYNEKHPAILAFWGAFFHLSLDERKKFLQFLMGTTRLPVQGIKAVEITIQPTAPELLPVAHTCANLLDLPNISDEKEQLRRLRISIEHAEGFTLV